MQDFSDIDGVAWSADEGVGFEVSHEHYVSFGIACACWYDGSADFFDALVEAECAGEHAVAEGDVSGVMRFEAACDEESRA